MFRARLLTRLGLRSTKMMIWRSRLWLFIVLFLQSDALSLSLSLSLSPLPASLLSRTEQRRPYLGQRESREAGEIRRDLSNFDKILWGWETLQPAVVNGKISSPPLLLHRQSFYLSLRFYRNCSVSDNSVCVREKEKEVIFCPESSQSSLLRAQARLDYNYQ